MIFDTHAHYDDEAFDEDRDALLRSMPELGVGMIVNSGASLQGIRDSIALSEKYSYIYAAVGVHPDHAGELNEETFQWLSAALDLPKVVAMGEIGLDYYWDNFDRELQKSWFDRQLGLAKEKGKPVVIHSREAAKDTLDIIKAAGGRDFTMDIHCFSYSKEMAREYLKLGYFLGIGGVVTFKNAKKLKEVVEYMPLDRILLETDCPYLAPVPYRGKRNHSGNLKEVVKVIAELKQVSYDEVVEATTKNAKEFYRL